MVIDWLTGCCVLCSLFEIQAGYHISPSWEKGRPTACHRNGTTSKCELSKTTGMGSGSCFHFCPRPCSSTYRWTRLATHRHWGPLCVYPVLSCPLWPCNHRMCVIAKETGLSPLARTCSRTWICLRRLHIWALRSLRLNTAHLRKPPLQKIGDNFPETWMSLVNVPMRVFRPAWAPLVQNHAHMHNCCCCNSKKNCEQETLLLQSQK